MSLHPLPLLLYTHTPPPPPSSFVAVFYSPEKMFSPLQVVLVTLSVSLLLCSVSSAPRGDMLLQLLRSEVDPKENELQDLSRLLLLKQLSESVAPEEKDALESTDDLEARNEVVRQIPLSQRERKAGCRNFYWKTFTSC
ncbi:somatostatin-1A-like [Sinocyclocheilus grahami]|uniref:somatostatin-1A-like n=1 Tax=Sinocyclocheilus grahami TaxID=75366 RepID=UPI0007AD58BA|nr:PREDICTED: somatostatin-1A-like [Sinocyclocheilus grahami]